MHYASGVVSLSDKATVIPYSLGHLTFEALRYGMCFVPSRAKVLLQDWQEPTTNVTLHE